MTDRPPASSCERSSAATGRSHKKLKWFLDRWRLPREPRDPRPYFEASMIFQARDMAQAEFLFDAMIEDVLGCNQHGPDEPCPNFRVGGLHQVDDD